MSSRCWCFTLNNYSSDDEKFLKDITKNYLVYGKEESKEGTPHLQGFIIFKRTYRLPQLKKLHAKIHWEVAKTPDAENYCMKDQDYYVEDNRKKKVVPYKCPIPDIKLFPWQETLRDEILGDPDDRTIIWVHDSLGGKGKTIFAKYLHLKYDALVVNGKKNDMFFLIKQYIDVNNKPPKIILADIPRCEYSYVSYGALEAIKSGLFASGKYESGIVCIPPPHLIIFSNFYLDQYIYSQDRVKLIELDQDACKKDSTSSEVPAKT